MAVRDFTDAAGNAWRAWHTAPVTDAVPIPGYERGWLSFECAGELRRLRPFPANLETVSDVQLGLLCRVATPVRRRQPGAHATDTTESAR